MTLNFGGDEITAFEGIGEARLAGLFEAESVLAELAAGFFQSPSGARPSKDQTSEEPNVEARYRALVEQIPAVVFMAYLDRGIGEAYVSPQIEASLGFSQKEWLEDPIRWYQQIHPDDKQRWSVEAAEMFLSGKPLRSAYRVISRDRRVIWFHCEAKMIRQRDGRPWFIHGVAFDITELKRTEEALHEERNVVTAILDTVGALVVVLDPDARIVRVNRACERMSGFSIEEVQGKDIRDIFTIPEELERFGVVFDQLRTQRAGATYESHLITRAGDSRLISWSSTVLLNNLGAVRYIIATGIDITEQKHLEKTILEVSGREQRRIGQDLHDGLGQHLTGIAFMSKVLEQRLSEVSLPEAKDAAKIVKHVNEAINTTRELARGLLPVLSSASGLMSALEQWAIEVEHLFRIPCHFRCEENVLIPDETVATHLYHIAQEGVHNAVKHARANEIVISLSALGDEGILLIEDDGVGIADPAPGRAGMGLHIMAYRARMIGGTLDVRRRALGGSAITCAFPIEGAETDP